MRAHHVPPTGLGGWALWAVRTLELSIASLLPAFTDGSDKVRAVVALLRSHS